MKQSDMIRTTKNPPRMKRRKAFMRLSSTSITVMQQSHDIINVRRSIGRQMKGVITHKTRPPAIANRLRACRASMSPVRKRPIMVLFLWSVDSKLFLLNT